MTMQDPKDAGLDGQPLELLIKLMKMTSAEDPIALVAIRKANAHIAKLGTDWDSLLRGKVKVNVIADPFANINIPREAMNPNRNQDLRPSPPPPPPPRRPPPWPTKPFPQSPVRPNPGSPAFTSDTKEKTIVNKFEGTCTKCKNRVPAGDGIAHLWKRPNGNTYWTTEHSGTCPPTRKHRPATTADDFQV